MKSKAIAIFGIVAYLLSVYASATNAAGQSTAPVLIVLLSGVAAILFVILATLRLWQTRRGLSLLLFVSSAAYLLLEVIVATQQTAYGSPVIVSLNIVTAIRFIAVIWAIFVLWKAPNKVEVAANHPQLLPEESEINMPVSDIEKQMQETDPVNLFIAIEMNLGRRNACLFFAFIASVAVLYFAWSKWLLIIPAVLALGAFLFQMNILIVRSELKRRSR